MTDHNSSGVEDLLRDQLVERVAALIKIVAMLDKAERDEDATSLTERIVALMAFIPAGAAHAEEVAGVDQARGWAQARHGDVEGALKSYDQAIKVFDQLKHWADAYHTRLAKAVALRDAGRWDAALATLTDADALDREYDVGISHQDRYKRLITVTGILANQQDSRELANRTEAGLRWIPFTPCRELALLLLQLGNHRLLLGDYVGAQGAYRDGVSVCRSIGDESMRYRILARSSLGYRELWRQTGDETAAEQAIQVGRDAFAGLTMSGDVREAVSQARLICQLLDDRGRAEEAIEVCRIGATAAARAEAYSDAFSLTAHAGFLSSYRLQCHSDAASLYLEALTWEAAAPPADLQRVVATLATLCYAVRDFHGAAKYLTQSSDLLMQIGAVSEAARERSILNRVLAEIGKETAIDQVTGERE